MIDYIKGKSLKSKLYRNQIWRVLTIFDETLSQIFKKCNFIRKNKYEQYL